jgi:hypothetical protein
MIFLDQNNKGFVERLYTVIIFLARNGRIRAYFWRISSDSGEVPPNQQMLRLKNRRNSPKSEEIRLNRKKFAQIGRNLPKSEEIRPNRTKFAQIGRNSPKSEEIRPKFLRANLKCASSPGSPKNYELRRPRGQIR